jgi:hypothetical protein
MKNPTYVVQSARWAALCVLLALSVSCVSDRGAGTGPTGETTPMADEATRLVFSYEMKNRGESPVSPEDFKPLGNTTWLVTSINPKPSRPFASMILKFRPDGKLVETTIYEGSSEQNETFSYEVIGSTLLIKKPKGEVNARFKVEGGLLVINTGDTSILLQKIKTK